MRGLTQRARALIVTAALLMGWVFLAPSNRLDRAMLTGDSFYIVNDGRQALRYYSRAYQIDPTSWRANVRLARLFEKTRNFDSATQFYLAALELAPEEPEVLESAAAYFVTRDEFGRAFGALKILLQQEPSNYEAHFLMSDLERRRGRIQRAELWLKKILERHPNHYEALWQLALIQKDVRPDAAVSNLRRMLKSGPTPARKALGVKLLEQLTGQDA